MAKLYFRFGAMNCGKSAALLQVAHNYEEMGMKVIIMKSAIDQRTGPHIVSRTGLKRPVDYLIGPAEEISEVLMKYKLGNEKIDCILVDEAQFLTFEQVDSLYRFAVIKGIPVICYGLRNDFLLSPFPGAQRLLSLAHTIEELKTICSCGKKATCNLRIIAGKPVFEGLQIVLDGDNVTYKSVCSLCYLRARSQAKGPAYFFNDGYNGVHFDFVTPEDDLRNLYSGKSTS